MRNQIRVLVVDDSAFMRYTISRHLQTDSEIVVVGSAQDGLDALSKIPALKPDVITLDVEMPRMDGLTALQRIMAEHPTPVIMLSSLTQRGTRTTIQALMRGAVDFVAKPANSAETRSVMDGLVLKIKAAAGAKTATPSARTTRGRLSSGSTSAMQTTPTPSKTGIKPFKKGDPLVVIGSSTGGPRALQTVLSGLSGDLGAAVVIVQHMPAGFTNSLAQRLNDISGLVVQEAADGDRLAAGLALLAPGDFHMQLDSSRRIKLDQGPKRNHVRPAVDITMETAAKHFGDNLIGVILTGMGSDGRDGTGAIKSVGGCVIAEDESTSVVYGMPRSVVEAGYADKILPLPEVAAEIKNMVKTCKTKNTT